MAGSKLSPRQKMINMMYLVLTALLALNVSAEILQAFESLRSSLETSATTIGSQNASLANHLIETIETKERSGNTKYSYVKGMIKDVTEQSESMVAYIDGLTKQLGEFGQRDPETRELLKKDEVDKNYRFWLGGSDHANGGRGNGEANILRQKLIDFTTWANELYARYDSSLKEPRFKPLVVEPREDPKITNSESKSKTWEYHTFHGKPVIADMAMMEKMKMDVREIQTGLLNLARQLSDQAIFTVDSLIAFEAPSAQVVAAGMKYTSVLGVGVASKNIRPEFMGNGIQVNPGGSTATMTIAANGAVIPSGQYEGIQHYTAMIKVPTASGEIQEIPVKGQFRVRKPEVVVRSKELQLLYKDCANNIEVDVPALGDEYNPDFSSSTGGKVIRKAASRKDITIVPTSPTFNLEISSRTNGQVVKLDKLTYRVTTPPPPSIIIEQRGQRVGPTSHVNRKLPVKVTVKADPEFAEALKQDARYTAAKVKVLYKSGLMPARVITEVSAAGIQKGVEVNFNVGDIRNATQGDKIFFEIEGLKRVNFNNDQVAVPGLSIYDLTIPAILN